MSVHWTVRYSTFAASVVSLSWFFAGWRQVMQSGSAGDWALLAFGTLLTIFLLCLQAYWIYFEEKRRGTLKKHIKLFELIHMRLEAKGSRQPTQSSEQTSTTSERGTKKQ